MKNSPMISTLYLTDEEQKLFPESLRTQHPSQPEALTFTDSEEKRQSRMRTLRLENPALQKFQHDAKTKTFTTEEVAKFAESLDFSMISQKDLMEISFAWGPDVFTALIMQALPAVKTAEDIKLVSTLSTLRHGLLLACNR